jgi:hypothetical protein
MNRGTGTWGHKQKKIRKIMPRVEMGLGANRSYFRPLGRYVGPTLQRVGGFGGGGGGRGEEGSNVGGDPCLKKAQGL